MAEDSTPRKKTVSSRVTSETYDQLSEYCDAHDLSQADALRQFIRDGLDDTRLSRSASAVTVVDLLQIALLLLILLGQYAV